MRYHRTLLSWLLGVAALVGSLIRGAAGPVLLVHGHADDPGLWSHQGGELHRASGGTRFFDSERAYFPGERPAAGFQSNGIYAVGYYSKEEAPGRFEPPISPVFAGAREIAPDDEQFRPLLYGQGGGLAARLAQIITRAHADSGQKVTLVCHSMGGLVAEAAIAYFGCHDKVEKLITLGTPLGGFPADFRVPTEIVANQSTRGFRFVRESLQMSRGVTYGGLSLPEHLENRFRVLRTNGIEAVCIVGTLNPFPASFLGGPSDGVVLAVDAQFRSRSIARVYSLPLAHMERMAETWLAREDSLCLSPRSTQLLEKEVLGIDPLPRLTVQVGFNFRTGRVRATLKNLGALPVDLRTVEAQFELLDPVRTNRILRASGMALGSVGGARLEPDATFSFDAVQLARGERAAARVRLSVGGREIRHELSEHPTYVANIQAPEIEAAVRYDFLNSVLHTEWDKRGGSEIQTVAWTMRYRIEGQVRREMSPARLTGRARLQILGGSGAEQVMLHSETFAFELDEDSGAFSRLGDGVLGKTAFSVADASLSPFRGILRAAILSRADQPGDFSVAGDFAAVAGVGLERPVFQYDSGTEGLALNFRGRLILSFDAGTGRQGIAIPIEAECSTQFVTDEAGVSLRPRVRRLSAFGVNLGENHRRILQSLIEANQLNVAPSSIVGDLEETLRGAIEDALGEGAVPAGLKFFDAVSIGVDVSPTQVRLLVDLLDDADEGGMNASAPIPENGITVQERLINRLLDSASRVLNQHVKETGRTTIKLGKELKVPGTSAYFDYPVLGPLSIGAGLDGVRWYFDRVRFTIGRGDPPVRPPWITDALDYDPEELARRLRVRFAGPEDRIGVQVPLDAKFYNQIRFYFALRIGVRIPFVGFVGYTKRWEEKGLRIQSNETLALDLKANLYPFIRNEIRDPNETGAGGFETDANQSIGVRFPPREVDIDTNLGASKGFLIPLAGELVVDPLANLAIKRPELLAPIGALVGATVGYFAPEILDAATADDSFGPAKQFSLGQDSFGDPEAIAAMGISESDLDRLGLGKVDTYQELAGPGLRPVLGTVGLFGGLIGGAKLADKLDDWLKPRRGAVSLPLPARMKLTGIDIRQRAAGVRVDVEPAYGDVQITRITGLDATNGVVALGPDDVGFGAATGFAGRIRYVGDGLSRVVSAIWIRKPLKRVRLHFRHKGIYANRYNDAAYRGYTLKHRTLGGGAAAVPADYAYDASQDVGTFSLDLAVTEGRTSVEEIQAKTPGLKVLTMPFLLGQDTAPMLVSAPYAAYSGVRSNLTISGSTFLSRLPGTEPPLIGVEELKLLRLDGAGLFQDLKPLGRLRVVAVTPSQTRKERLYGAQFSWTGRLPAEEFPEGAYAVLVTLRDSRQDRRGALLIPVILDRTPPEVSVGVVPGLVPVVSKHKALPLAWRVDDEWSAVLREVELTYWPEGGAPRSGAVFASAKELLAPGSRRFSFQPGLETAGDGIEQLHALRIQAVDIPGNRGSSTNLPFLVDTRPPSLLGISVLPAGGLGHHAILNQSNRILSVSVDSHEAFTARFTLGQAGGGTNIWETESRLVTAQPPLHRTTWILELPEFDPDQGLLEGVVADGVHALGIELVDGGRNTNSFPAFRSILVDRRGPVMSLGSQETFVSGGEAVYPLDLDRSQFKPGDEVVRVALVDLNMTHPDGVPPVVAAWDAPSGIASILAGGIPLDSARPGGPLGPGYYGVEVIARDPAGNESRITTQFGYRALRPHVELQGQPHIAGVVPVVGIALDPDPTDRFRFKSRELYWAAGSGVPLPANLDRIDPAVWKTSGFYTLPPRGGAFARQSNASVEMVSRGILAYWNSTGTAIPFEGDVQASVDAAGIGVGDVTVLLVVRDDGGRSMAATASARVDNRAVDPARLTLPGVAIRSSAVADRQLRVEGALYGDTPGVQMVIQDAVGNVVHREARSAVESRNSLLGTPRYSLVEDFGFFVWFDPSTSELRVRCVAPERGEDGRPLTAGHTFHFSVTGAFGTNDLAYHQVSESERAEGAAFHTDDKGFSRAVFALSVAPGTEKGLAVRYTGGTVDFNALAIDDYLEALYEDGTRVRKLLWRADDAGSVFPNPLALVPARNLSGFDGVVMRGRDPEPAGYRAVANHAGVLGHVFLGRGRSEPISPMRVRLDSAVERSDLAFGWDLRRADGTQAEPGDYEVLLFSIDDLGGRFHCARRSFRLGRADVPFRVGVLQFEGSGAFDPVGDGGIHLRFNTSRGAVTTVRVLDEAARVVSTLVDRQFIAGRMDTNAPHRVWWDGLVDGSPAAAGRYVFEFGFEVDGEMRTERSGPVAVRYGETTPKESDWKLLAQPIAFDPENRDRIVRGATNDPAGDRAWVTLRFDAVLSDGSREQRATQVVLKEQERSFQSVISDPGTGTYIGVSSLFPDAVQSFERIQVRFNDRIVDMFPGMRIGPEAEGTKVDSRTGQFQFYVREAGVRAFRVQVVLKARLKPWREGLLPVFTEDNRFFDPEEVREFVADMEFREVPGQPGVVRSLPWKLDHVERIWGLENIHGALFARHGWALLGNLADLEVRDRTGRAPLGRFNASQIRAGGLSAVDALFRIVEFTDRKPAEAIGIDLVLEASLPDLLAKAQRLEVPITPGYVGIDAVLEIPDSSVIRDDLDPFPTRRYHAQGKKLHNGLPYDDVRAYAGDSGLVEEIGFSGSRMAGHALFDYALRPSSEGGAGQQLFEVHPWVPYSFRKPAGASTLFRSTVSADLFGMAVGSAGDVNGDGIDELFISAPLANTTGRVYLYSASRSQPLGQYQTLSGTGSGARFGWAASAAGDVNGDGIGDFVVGAVRSVSGSTEVGSVTVYHGGRSGLNTTPARTLFGTQAGAQFGRSVASAGDVNGDGFDDIIVGAPRYENASSQADEGFAFVWHGSRSGIGASPNWTEQVNQSAADFGWSVAGIGDVNGDGLDDVAVGAPRLDNGQSNEGRVYVYHGSRTGLPTTPAWTGEGNAANAVFGYSVAGGKDIDGNGRPDVVVGAPGHSSGRGAVFVYLSGPAGLGSRSQLLVGPVGGTRFGASVAMVKDVNADGFADVVVGTDATTGRGGAWVYLGSSNGLVQSAAWQRIGRTTGGGFGTGVGGGDVDGDGYGDVVVGEPYYDFSSTAQDSGAADIIRFPQAAILYQGWARRRPGGSEWTGALPKVLASGLQNLNPAPLANSGFDGRANLVRVEPGVDATGRSNTVHVSYSRGRSGYATNAPFPLLTSDAPAWVARSFSTVAAMASVPVPIDPVSGQTNTGWQLGLRFGADTNDLILAATAGAYDAVVTDAVIDYEGLLEPDPSHDPTVNHFSDRSVWEIVAPRLPGYPGFSGIPAVLTDKARRPQISITNVVVRHDPRLPGIGAADLRLGFTPAPAAEGWETAFVRSDFSHAASGFYRDWTLGEDPNLKAAAVVPPERVRLIARITGYSYDALDRLRTNETTRVLLDDVAVDLVDGRPATRMTTHVREDAPSFRGFATANVEVEVIRGGGGEAERVRLERLDLLGASRAYRVRSARYQVDVTPMEQGEGQRELGFEIAVTLDPPIEYSTRHPVRRGDRIVLPLQVIDRERFWQVDSGERVANLFREVGIEGRGRPGPEPAYWIDELVGYTQVDGSKPLFGQPDYAAKADALFWRTSRGTVIKNPRVVIGQMTVSLKDPSGREESPAFRGRRYVHALTNEYFHDMYAETNEGSGLSWTARIRPQAKEHAYVKVYGSVGGAWRLSYRPKGNGQASGLLPLDAPTPEWTLVRADVGHGQNQFLAYWDITELNGAYVLKLESGASPVHAPDGPEVSYLEVMLGQHLPGRNNPIFSPGGQPETASLFSMHGRTQLTSSPADRAADDLFFTVNPMKIDERPFSLGPSGTIPLGERVQVLPHTEFNPFSVSFYIDLPEYRLYDRFALYHQLESGELDEIVSLPPVERRKYALIQGYVRHTSTVGFLPNPSLRSVTLDVPQVSPDGLIRVAGAIPLHGRNSDGMADEGLEVAIVISPEPDFYQGEVRARLKTGVKAEFPVASEAAKAVLPSGWRPGDASRSQHVFAIVVDPKDDWLTLGRRLTPEDANQHLFNLSRSTVTMTTNIQRSLKVLGDRIFSPNGDGIADEIGMEVDFGRAGRVQLEIRAGDGELIHLIPVALDALGRGRAIWDGRMMARGMNVMAPDDRYVATAVFSSGDVTESADAWIEVRAASRYRGVLGWSGTAPFDGGWRVSLFHTGQGHEQEDRFTLEYSDSPGFGVVRGGMALARDRLLEVIEVDVGSLAAFATDSSGNATVYFRMKAVDRVGNLQTGESLAVSIPVGRRLAVRSVNPAAGAGGIEPDVVVEIGLAAPSPFTESELAGLFEWWPSVPRTVRVSPDGMRILVTAQQAFEPGGLVTAALALRQGVRMPAPGEPAGADVLRWNFRLLPPEAIQWTFNARLRDPSLALQGNGAEGILWVQAAATGAGLPRLRIEPRPPSPGIVTAAASDSLVTARPPGSTLIPVTVRVTAEHEGVILLPLDVRSLNGGSVTTLVASVVVARTSSVPVVHVVGVEPEADSSLKVRFSGRTRGRGPVSTLARVNGGAWWRVADGETWSFEAGFAAGGDRLEITARDADGRLAETYVYILPPPPLRLSLADERTLSWEAQLGMVYSVEWSRDLERWEPVLGVPREGPGGVVVEPGASPARIADLRVGRVSVRLGSAHEAANAAEGFYRIREGR